MNYFDALKTIRNGEAYPVYVILGEEEYLREQAVNILIDRFVDKNTRDFNFNTLSGEDADDQFLYNLLTSFPMMSEKRTVLIKGANLLSANAKEAIKKYSKKLLLSTVLIIEAEKISLREKVFSELKNNSFWFEFKRLYQNQLPSWIRRYTEKRNINITKDAIDTLIGLCDSSLRDISNEIEKIVLYMGEKNNIDKNVVLEVTGSSKTHNIFELMNYIGSKNLPRAFEIIDKMLERGESPIGIIIMLSTHISRLLKTKEHVNKLSDAEISKNLKINRFFVNQYIEQSKNYSESELEKCFDYLLKADFLMKRGVRNYRLLMNILISQITGTKNSGKKTADNIKNKKFEIMRELSEIYLVR